MDLDLLISSLKEKGTTSEGSKKGFIYRSPDRWIDLENNYFPKGLRGDSFTIKFKSFEHHNEIEELGVAHIVIEFLADTKNDLYGKKFNEMQWIVNDMCQVSQAFLKEDNQYKECEFDYAGDIVVVTFNIALNVDSRRIEWETVSENMQVIHRPINNTPIT